MRNLILVAISLALSSALPAVATAQNSFKDDIRRGAPPQIQQPQGQPPQIQQPQVTPKSGQTRPSPATPNAALQDPLTRQETQDLGVPAVRHLHPGPMHGPTPASIPGGRIVTTRKLVEMFQGRQTPFVVLDILGGPEVIPGAVSAVPAHQPGSFNDDIQRGFGGFLNQLTRGNKEVPIVLYCQSINCWMSYNASLRAINLGYRNVLWYRGGIEAWKQAGQQTQSN